MKKKRELSDEEQFPCRSISSIGRLSWDGGMKLGREVESTQSVVPDKKRTRVNDGMSTKH